MKSEEAVKILDEIRKQVGVVSADNEPYCIALDSAIAALIQVQQYQNIGTVSEIKELASLVNMAERDSLAKVVDEWNEYRKIGTIDECRQAVEKPIPIPIRNKKVIMNYREYSISGECPVCRHKVSANNGNYCSACGCHLKWNVVGIDA